MNGNGVVASQLNSYLFIGLYGETSAATGVPLERPDQPHLSRKPIDPLVGI